MINKINGIKILGYENLLEKEEDTKVRNGLFLIPKQLTYNQLKALESLFKDYKIIYTVEESSKFEKQIALFLNSEDTDAFIYSQNETNIKDFQNTLIGLLDEKSDQKIVIIYIPGKVSSWPGSNIDNLSKNLIYLINLELPIIPLFTVNANDLELNLSKNTKENDIIFSFGKEIPNKSNKYSYFQEEMLKAGTDAFNTLSSIKMNLGEALIRGLKKYSRASGIFDGFTDSYYTYEKILSASLCLSKKIKNLTHKKRVGVVLPPGTGGYIANFAVIFADKIPVNLNFTASKSALEFAIAQADIDLMLTANSFKNKVSTFPWFENDKILFLEKVMPSLKLKILINLLFNKILPVNLILKFNKISNQGGDKEAALLYTSGSSGQPKGVPLSHENLLANVCQFSSRLPITEGEKILASLPLFHSFGLTVTLWYPIIHGLTVVTFPSPLEVRRLANLIDNGKISLLLATPTFLRAYLYKAKDKQLNSLKLIISGAEKLPVNLAKSFEKKFNKQIMEGYGLTETSPVTNFNLPNKTNNEEDEFPIVESYRLGSVGQLISGISLKITHPQTNEQLPINQSGQIWLKGANIFNGYLDRPALNKSIINNGWFATGDIGRLDEDGFLYIEGRLSRFSKIGGEMVPHENIENLIVSNFKIDENTEKIIAVTSKPDSKKGEVLVLLHIDKFKSNIEKIRKVLSEQGVPNLWMPKNLVLVEKIPTLASGKLDLQECKNLAQE